jgi:putative endonuclease
MTKISHYRQAIGGWGEKLAADYLAEHGYEILGRNLRTRYGEIDILARVNGCLVFVEVKTRTNADFGEPESSVGARKQAHLLAAAQTYIQEHPNLGTDWRFDVVAIKADRDHGQPEITVFENAFS